MNRVQRCFLAVTFMFLSLTVPFVKGFTGSPTPYYQKINIASAISTGKATVRASAWDIGRPENCFDANRSTIMRSANVNPAFVQVTFADAREVRKLRVLIGQPGYAFLDHESWWVESADNQVDMDTKSGSYRMVVPRRDRVESTWDSLILTAPVTAKIWKFNIERTLGDGYVHIPELELFSNKVPVLSPVLEEVDPYMATPAENSANIVPVLIIRFLPTENGVNLDVKQVPEFWWLGEITLDSMKKRIDLLNKRIKFMLEEGSRYHGYKNPDAQPMLGLKVVGMITVYENTPPGQLDYIDAKGFPVYLPDYFEIFQRFNVKDYVEKLGVKHIWFWTGNLDSGFPSYLPDFHDLANFRGNPEANMSSRLSGDISNSHRSPSDLPVYDQSFIVFGNNYRRGQNEAVGHNYGHQIEQMLLHIDKQADGASELFWQKFVGANQNMQSVTGRCGWNHMPPNTTLHYDYFNPTLVQSDIEDWTPASTGEKKWVNVETWMNLSYKWPAGTEISDIDDRTVSNWHIYWLQALPGIEAKISYNDYYQISNWWDLILNWDEAIAHRKQLYQEGENFPRVVKFRLWDADADTVVIEDIEAYGMIGTDIMPINFSLEVVTSRPVGSVYIYVNGLNIAEARVENEPPYASFGDTKGDFHGRQYALGSLYNGGVGESRYYIHVELFDRPNGNPYNHVGSLGTKSMYIDLIRLPEFGDTYYLVDSQTDERVLKLEDGAVLSIESLPQEVAIEVVKTDHPVALQISTKWSDRIQTAQVERIQPFASFGDQNGNFKGKRISIGHYQVDSYAIWESYIPGFESWRPKNNGFVSWSSGISFEIVAGSNARMGNVNAEGKRVVFSIYPNPVTEVLHIAAWLADGQIAEIEVINASGQQVFAGRMIGGAPLAIPAHHWPKGLYVVKWAGPEGGQSAKLLVE